MQMGPVGLRILLNYGDLLAQRKSGYRDFEDNKLNIDGFYHPNQHRPRSIFTKGRHFLEKLLEVTYETFKNAGEPWEKVSSSNTGVFVWNFNYDHQLMQVRDADHTLPCVTTGGGIRILSNRMNYVFNLHEPR